jgi:transcriptional regulator with AAA-type ATPase domain
MPHSILDRLFQWRKRERGPLSLVEGARSAGTRVGAANSQGIQPAEQKPVPVAKVDAPVPVAKVNALFAFVDLKDPFVWGEIAGDELPGPILSILSAKCFANLFLFNTPHTRQNAIEIKNEVSQRYPECRIVVHELPVSDPKDYSSVMGQLSRLIRDMGGPTTAETNNYVCVSSGTAEMRAAWFLLYALGFLRAKLLQVGSPVNPLFGPANVREVRLDSDESSSVRQLAMPWQYYLGRRGLTMPTAVIVGARQAPSREKIQELGSTTRRDEEAALFGPQEQTGSPLSIGSDPSSFPGLEDALQEVGIHVGSSLLRFAAEQAVIAAESHLPVLLTGETGTGKERFAHLIHRMSPRSSSEIVAINCAAIPETLAESYLFGHVKGAYTGATSDKKGVFESADKGTLFLDEIVQLSLEIQAKLLRIIQDGVVHRLGSSAPRQLNVRIIAATNRDLGNEVAAGRFREDLYFRLEVVQIKLPPLRERRGEIPGLALALLKQINQRRQKPRQLSKGALLRLEHYGWPGNVRQLSNTLERSVLYARRDVLEPDDLLITEDQPQQDPLATIPEPFQGFSIEKYLSQVRKQLFLRALATSKNNQAEAATLLGVSKQAVSKFVAGQTDNSH